MAEFSMEVFANRNLMEITVKGEVTGDEIVDAVVRYYGPGMTANVLWNFMDADLLPVTSGDVQSFVAQASVFAEFRPGGKTAFAQSSNLGYGLNRMYELTAEAADYPVKLAVFRDLDDALGWIDSPE